MIAQQKILGGLVQALSELLKDRRLGQFGTRERTVMGRLARFMGPYYEDWDIDTDHERRGDDPKYLDILPNGEPGERRIIPDIVVHKLGEEKNLLVVELKLNDNANIALDIWKLEHMTRNGGLYCYAVGAHIVLDLEQQTVFRSTVFANGIAQPELTEWFQGHFNQVKAN